MASPVNYIGCPAQTGRSIDWVAVWILFSAWCSLSGWLLSFLGILNKEGYGISFLLFFLLLWLFRQPLGFSARNLAYFPLRPFRFRHWLPRLWVLLTVLTFVGGLLYHPNNYDCLTYRFPRVLHWCWEQKWHWIATTDGRMNLAATGFEWLMTPLFIFFKTDRLFFLINIISFLLLPGLIFSVFQRMGISKRVSWWWMWILPSAYCFALQAGSVSNDLFASIYMLASLLYILKAEEPPSRPAPNFIYSCFSVALLTGAKASNIPLALPWLIAAYMQRAWLLKIKPIILVGALLLASCVSFLPNAFANIYFTGSYTGEPDNLSRVKVDNPVAGLVGNTILLSIVNVRPPVWPDQVLFNSILPLRLKEYLNENIPRLGIHATVLDQIEKEETGSLGIGITASIFLMIGLRWWARTYRPVLLMRSKAKFLPVMVGAWLALLVTVSKLGSEAIPRLLAPYYPLLIASILILIALDGSLIRFFVCRIFAVGVMSVSIFLIIISPARPLFPTQWAADVMAKVSPSRVERLERVYGVYGSRYDAMKDIRVLLPEDEKSVGFLQSGDDVNAPLWLPYGSRKVVDVSPDQTLDQLKSEHIHLIVADDFAIKYKYKSTIDELTTKWSASVFAKRDLNLRASTGLATWYIIALP